MSDMDENDILENIQVQNPDIGLGIKEINNTDLVFRTGPRNKETVKWVLETDPDT